MKNSVPLEATIVKNIVKAVNAIPGCLVKKHHGHAMSPSEVDLYGAARGRAVFMEVKRPGGRATPRQEKMLRDWSRAGALAGVVHSVDDALALIGITEAADG